MKYTFKPISSVASSNEHIKRIEPLTVDLGDFESNDESLVIGKAISKAHELGKHLIGYDLSGANCQFSWLEGVVIIGCDLTNADFTGSWLVNSTFKLSNLTHTNFKGCYGRNAKVKDSDANALNVISNFYSSHSIFGRTEELDSKFTQK